MYYETKIFPCSFCGADIEGTSEEELVAAREEHMTTNHADRYRTMLHVVNNRELAAIHDLFNSAV